MAGLGKLATSVAGSTFVAGAQVVTIGREAAAAALHRRTAAQLLEALGSMKGLPMKVGQILSYMDGVIPPEHQATYREALSRLQVRAAPLPWDAMRPVLERELGGPITKHFATFDPNAIAAASLGQVYRATLIDGRAVAVKVQYPGIGADIRRDTGVLTKLTKVLSRVLPGVEIDQMRGDMIDRLMEECDYRLEARNQNEFASLWADDSRVVIPEVVSDKSTGRVLVTALQHGRSFTDLAADPDERARARAGETMFWFVMRSILRHGRFNADPHPGNFLFPERDAVVFLDFGCVQRYGHATRVALRELCTALVNGLGGDALWEIASRALELNPAMPTAQRELTMDYLGFCFEPVLAKQPFRYTPEYTARLSAITAKTKMALLKTAIQHGWHEPKREGLVMFSRILFGMNSLLAALKAESDWRTLVSKAIDQDEASASHGAPGRT